MFYIYQIVGPTGKYIGKTSDIRKRWGDHQSHAAKGANTRVHRAMRKHGIALFFFEVILQAQEESAAFDCERAIILQAKNQGCTLYNSTLGGEGFTGGRHTAESRARISAAGRGRKHSEASLQKLRLAQQNRSPEWRAKLSQSHTGKKLSAEHRQKLSDAHKGVKLSAAHRASLSAERTGRKMPPRTAEHKEKLRQAGRRRKASPETRAKMSQARSAYLASKRAEKAEDVTV